MSHTDRLAEITKEAGCLAQTLRVNHKREFKQDRSIVTAADRETESFLRTELTALIPGTTVWGEEEGYSTPGPNGLWLVDPIDGTTNFSFGSPLWGVSVALLQGDELVLGAIDLPDLNRLYVSERGGGVVRNGIKLSHIAPGAIEHHEPVGLPDTINATLEPLARGKMRHFGAWVIEACWLLEGWSRAIISDKTSLYDIAASLVMFRELGARVMLESGGPIVPHALLGLSTMPEKFIVLPPEG